MFDSLLFFIEDLWNKHRVPPLLYELRLSQHSTGGSDTETTHPFSQAGTIFWRMTACRPSGRVWCAATKPGSTHTKWR
jgi:hypothetical protein